MPKKLYTFCCRLCLHDGSVNQLLDIYSIKALEEKVLKVFNIQVTNRDSCTTNICLPCFQETLALEQQMMQYLKHKQNILNNQHYFQKNDAARPSTSLSASLNKAQTVDCNQSKLTDIQPVSDPKISVKKSSDGSRKSHNKKTESSPSVHQTALNNGNTQLKLSVNANSETDKTKKNKNSSVKVKDKDIASQSSSKKISSKEKSRVTHKSHSQENLKSPPAVPTGQQQRATTKPTGDGLEKQSSSKNNPPESTKRQNATNQTQPTKMAKDKDKIHIGSKKSSNDDVQLCGSEDNAKRTKTSLLHKSPDNIIPNLPVATIPVSQVPDTVSTIEQNIPAYMIERTAPQETNQQPQSLQMVMVENSSMPSQHTKQLPGTVTSQPGVNVSSPGRQRAFSQEVNSTLPILPLQGGLCTSIPLENISSVILPNESRIVNTASSVSQAGPSSNTSTSQGQQSPMPLTNFFATRPNESQHVASASTVNLPGTSTNVPMTAGQQLTSTTDSQTASCVVATANQLDESRNRVNNATSPGAIKKRRHSTFIRVSSNLFDEPAEKAQFAMLNNNQFIRSIEPLPDVPALMPYPVLPVLPQGLRVQTVPNPRMMMPFNNYNCNTISPYPTPNNVGTVQRSLVPTSQNNSRTQPIANSTHYGNNYGAIIPRTVNTSTIGQRPFTISLSTQQSNGAPNNNIRSNHTEYMRNSQFSGNSTVQSTHIVTKPPNSAQDKQIRACYKCNICSSYYLLESSLVVHLRRIHQLEKCEQTCSVIYNPVICNTLMSRVRRKSVADPLLLSNNRT